MTKAGRGHGGRGNNNGGRGRGRGNNHANANSTAKRGSCAALGKNVFDYGHKAAADEMRTSWEKVVQCVGTACGQDISNELQNKGYIIVTEPIHSQAMLDRHAARVQVMARSRDNLQRARATQKVTLEAAANSGDAEAPMKLAVLNNEALEAECNATQDTPMALTELEKTQCNNEWRTHCERDAQLVKNRGQAFSLVLGQCTQLLQDKMKQDADWSAMSASHDPLKLC